MSVPGAQRIHFRVSVQVIFQAFGYIFSLGDNGNTLWGVLPDFVQKQRIVRTSQHQCVHPSTNVSICGSFSSILRIYCWTK